MSRLRIAATAGRRLRSALPSRRTARTDLVAGIPGAIARVPDGMASAALIGVNPVYGLYASAAGPLFGGLTQSTRLMVITTTSAAALAAGSALDEVAAEDRAPSLFLLTIIAGAIMIAAGALRLGRLTGFVSHSVMVGFLTGVALNIGLGQLDDVTGIDADGETSVEQAWSVLTHLGAMSAASLLVAAGALALILALNRTRLAVVSALAAVVVPTAVVVLTGADVKQVSDAGEIPSGLPLPHLPEFALFSVDLLVGAAAVAVIVLVQGAGVAESAPNPDDSTTNPDRDFISQGIANLASGLVRGQPVGGSVGQTAINLSFGAVSRWASIFSGLWMLLILLALSRLIGHVASPILAAILIYAAVGSVRPADITTIWKTGALSRIAMVATFLATLTLPVTAAVGLGVTISLLLQLNREALDLRVVQLVRDDSDRLVEQPGPHALRDDSVVVLDIYGSLFYAGAKTLQQQLPDPGGSHRASVVVRLRGRSSLGATFSRVMTEYAYKLAAHGGRLYLSGLSPMMLEQIDIASRTGPAEPIRTFAATAVIGESTQRALNEARAWLLERRDPGHDSR